jgi:adenine phosphoribosyltransferase
MSLERYLDRMGTDTVGRYDVTPLFADPDLFADLRVDLFGAVDFGAVSHIVGIDALGFALGGAVAAERDVGFVPVRKGGKLPYPPARLHRQTFTDYSGEQKRLELHREALTEGDRVLVVDDWVETGAQMRAATSLVEATGAAVAGIAALRVEGGEGAKPLFDAYEVHSVR